MKKSPAKTNFAWRTDNRNYGCGIRIKKAPVTRSRGDLGAIALRMATTVVTIRDIIF